MSGKPVHLAVWSEWGCFTEPQVNVCLCDWHWTVACLEEQVALSTFQCWSSVRIQRIRVFQCDASYGSLEFLTWSFLWSVFKCMRKAYKQFGCKCLSFTCTLNFNSSFFILHLFFMLTISRTQRGFQNFIKCEMRNIFRLVALGKFSGASFR